MSEEPAEYTTRQPVCTVGGVEQKPLTDAQLREAFEIDPQPERAGGVARWWCIEKAGGGLIPGTATLVSAGKAWALLARMHGFNFTRTSQSRIDAYQEQGYRAVEVFALPVPDGPLKPAEVSPEAAALLLQALSTKTADNGRLMAEVEELRAEIERLKKVTEQFAKALTVGSEERHRFRAEIARLLKEIEALEAGAEGRKRLLEKKNAEIERQEKYIDEAAALLGQARERLYLHWSGHIVPDYEPDRALIAAIDRLLGTETVEQCGGEG